MLLEPGWGELDDGVAADELGVMPLEEPVVTPLLDGLLVLDELPPMEPDDDPLELPESDPLDEPLVVGPEDVVQLDGSIVPLLPGSPSLDEGGGTSPEGEIKGVRPL